MAKKKSGPRVYIGPSLPGLPQYTVFASDKLSPHVAEMAKKDDNIAGLIVPVEILQESRQNMRTKGHILHTYAKNLMNKEQ